MKLAAAFYVRLAAWLGGFLLLVLLAVLAGSLEQDLVWLQVTTWVAGGLALAAFPAGISVARRVIEWDEPRFRPLIEFAVMTALLGIVVFLVRGYIAPWVAASEAEAASGGGLEGATLVFHERPAAVREAEARAEAGPQTVEAWLPANRIAWNLDGTITGAAMAVVFAWLGVLVGAWASGLDRRELRQLLYWGLGLFLLMTGYLMNENTYELILMKMAGPAYFGPWFSLISPGMLFVGLAIPTAIRLYPQLRPS